MAARLHFAGAPQVAAIDASVDLSRTLVVVASKSGSTLEPNIFQAYFYQRMVEAVGAKVSKLVRVKIGTIAISGLQIGKWRLLTRAEVASLK